MKSQDRFPIGPWPCAIFQMCPVCPAMACGGIEVFRDALLELFSGELGHWALKKHTNWIQWWICPTSDIQNWLNGQEQVPDKSLVIPGPELMSTKFQECFSMKILINENDSGSESGGRLVPYGGSTLEKP